MNDPSSKKATRYFQSAQSDLQPLFEKIKELEILNHKISAYLDPVIKKYCQVANCLENRLIIVVANGSVATQIRFQAADLLRKFKQDPMLQKIQDIQCKVRLPLTTPRMPLLSNKPGKQMERLSPATADIVRETAASLEDPILKEIMQRIAKHVK